MISQFPSELVWTETARYSSSRNAVYNKKRTFQVDTADILVSLSVSGSAAASALQLFFQRCKSADLTNEVYHDGGTWVDSAYPDTVHDIDYTYTIATAWLTSSAVPTSSSHPLTQAYNTYYEDTKTDHEVWEILCDLYGANGTYDCFRSIPLSGAFNQNTYPTSSSNWGHVYPETFPMSRATDAPLTWSDPTNKLVFTGDSYDCSSVPGTGTTSDIQRRVYGYIIFADTSDNKLLFKMFINGTKDANISCRWYVVEKKDDFSLQLVTPIVWAQANGTPYYLTREIDGIEVPNEQSPVMSKYVNTWVGRYDKPYLSEFAEKTSGMTDFEKVAYYGIDGIADSISYLLRFNKQKNEDDHGVMTWGDCYIVTIPREVNSVADITVTSVNNSRNNPEFSTDIEIVLGPPPEEIPDDDDDYADGEDATGGSGGVYNPDDVIPDFTPYESQGFSGKAVLTRTYSMNTSTLQNIGTKLWTQSYFDVMRIQNNPIENIVSCKWFPFSITGTSQNVKVGDVDLGIPGSLIDGIYKFAVGTYTYDPGSDFSYLDCSPYTTIKLHLPYCGVVQLDATEILRRVISIRYVVDLISGDCMAFIYLDNIPFMNVSGHMGVDIPLTSSNRIQTEMRAASSTISAVVGASAHLIGGDVMGAAGEAATSALNIAGMDYNTQRTSSHSPACTSSGNRAIYIEIFKQAFPAESAGYKARHGYPCYKYMKLSDMAISGQDAFVKCDLRTKIDFAMTSRENEMLEQLLTSGVYV